MRRILDKARVRAGRAARTLALSSVAETVVILNYHRVNEPTSVGNLTVSEENFREQMRLLREKFEPVPLESLYSDTKPITFSNKRKKVAVTFDDGYADTYLKALPVLKEFDIPASVYITTGMIDKSAEFWWDELEGLLTARLPAGMMPKVRQVLESADRTELTSAEGRERIYPILAYELRRSGATAIHEALEALRMQSDTHPLARDPLRPLSAAELVDLSHSSLIEIGAHTVSHACLGILSRENQKRELVESKGYLEQTLGRKVVTVAYPYGDAGDYNEDTCEVAEELGFKLGLTTEPGVASAWSDPYRVPRMFVKDWSGDEFGQRLNRCFWIG